MATTNENIVLGVDIKTGNAVASFKSLKAEARALEQALASGKLEGEAFTTAARRAGELKDRIKDAKDTVNAFNPEAKFQAFAGVLGGVANGFAVAQGAAALFGGENEDIQKAILKTQSAIAIATGLNGLLGMKDAFTILSQVIKTQVVTAFGTMRAAIMSTGIIALVAVIGTLIYAWYQEKEANDEATKSLKDYDEAVKKTRQEQQDLAVQLLEGRTKELTEIANETTKKILELNDKIKAIRDLASAEQREFTKAELVELESYKAQQLLINDIGDKNIKDLNEKYAKEDADKKKEQREKELSAAQKHAEDLKKWQADAEKKYNEDRDKRYAQRDEDDADAQAREDYRIALQQKTLADIKKTSDAKIELAKAEKDAQLNTLQATAAGINSISQLVGEQTAAGKALGVASATIDTYVGATKAFAQGGTLGFVSAGAIVLAGLANVKRILSVKVPSINGQSANSLPSAPSSVPQLPQQFNATRLSQETPLLTRDMNRGSQKVYVLESDMTDAQRRVKGIKDKATIG
jgi:hypothetical protein